MRENAVSKIAAVQHTVTHGRFFHAASVPNTVTTDWVCPLGKEYPVAASRAASTMVKLSSSTHGRGIRKIAFSSWLSVFPTSPMKKNRNPHFLSRHHSSAMPTSMNTVSSPNMVMTEAMLSRNGERIDSSKRKKLIDFQRSIQIANICFIIA